MACLHVESLRREWRVAGVDEVSRATFATKSFLAQPPDQCLGNILGALDTGGESYRSMEVRFQLNGGVLGGINSLLRRPAKVVKAKRFAILGAGRFPFTATNNLLHRSAQRNGL
ncbi:unnamed protein product [Nezara viridula]|uniref:Uncharacterized protein n=1 Tax=Nezara viridula TaxID=85310 RepID=A0A9P0HPY4_NEZVI|nr:unnamed protein product [Nezara viridula]